MLSRRAHRRARVSRTLATGSIALAVVLAGSCGGARAADAVDDIVAAELARRNIPGAVVAVLKNGILIKTAAYGFTDLTRSTPVTVDTVFRLQSISKQFTATAVMMLIEEGKIRLDGLVKTYIEATPAAWDTMTVRHLLTQTSGLRDFVNEAARDLTLEATEGEWLASVASQSLKFRPGAQWDYSNTNYLVLGAIIRKVTGQWYGDTLATRIFEPLGMTRTSIARDRDAAAKGFTRSQGGVLPSRADATLAMSVLSYAGGGVQSTVMDLAKWEMALRAGRLLQRESFQQMWTPGTLNDGTKTRYGFGWEIDAVGSHRHIWHAGIWTGFAAQIDRFPDDDLSVIVLTNLDDAAPDRISRAVAAAFVPGLAAPRDEAISDREPAVTARLQDVLRRGAEGTLRQEDFTPSLWTYLSGNAAQVQRDFVSLGTIQNLTLVERTAEDGSRSYRYRARFPKITLLYHFVLVPDGRIAVMIPEP